MAAFPIPMIVWLTLIFATQHGSYFGYILPAEIGYDLSAPDAVYNLPSELAEISGITGKSDREILCVQDEHEIIFIYDIRLNQITSRLDFGFTGDYEGIARAGQTVYILRSDGRLTEIANYESPGYARRIHATGIPWKDNEGLCYDKVNHRLLIGPKETPGKDSGEKGNRYIYAFELVSEKLAAEPVHMFRTSDIEDFAATHDISTPMKGEGTGKKPDIKMKISAIAVHPFTGDLFVLSGNDRLLYVFEGNGSIRYLTRLDKDLLGQPEGITFLENGDMLLSSEGSKQSATLVLFRYRP